VSIDCMHWQWHNCPVGWQSQFTWWHQTSYNHPRSCYFSLPLDLTYFFRVVKSNNDINVLNQSSLFFDVIRGHTHEVTFIINGNEHHIGYYLTDDIYPSWPVFMKGVPLHQQGKHWLFLAKQSTLKKDVECTFDLLKKRFNILTISSRSCS
jgi:hypothetical protein